MNSNNTIEKQTILGNNVMVKSEFQPLKKVVLTQSEFIFPRKEQMLEGSDKVLTEETKEHYKGIYGLNYGEAFPERQRLWEQERENLKNVLEKYGVEVLRPRLLTEYEKEMAKKTGNGCSNFFTRDPFFTIGNHIIEGNLRYPHRRNEILPIRNILDKIGYDSDSIYISLPRPDTSDGESSEKGPFLEGGDVLVLDKLIFVGKSGQASNDKGYHWLKKYLGHFGYTVKQVPLKNTVLHLDCALSFVRKGLMIIAEEAFIDGIPEELKNWDKISVPFKDIEKLAVNGLPVNESVYIMDPEFDYIAKELIKRGVKPEFVDFKITRSFGGSFRCSTQPLVRE